MTLRGCMPTGRSQLLDLIDCNLWRLTPPQMPHQGLWRDLVLQRELSRGHPLACCQRDELGKGCPVCRLGVGISPATIRRFIVTGGINAIKRMLRRWRPSHIEQEGGKVGAPSIAHRHASRAIGTIEAMGRGVAACLGILPRAPLFRVTAVLRIAVCGEAPSRPFLRPAPAAFRAAVLEARELDDADGSTGTSTTPMRLAGQTPTLVGLREDGPAAELLSGDVTCLGRQGRMIALHR